MQGYDVMWLPGSDHAGIATQMVVERYLDSHLGETRMSLGGDKFREAIWQWKEK